MFEVSRYGVHEMKKKLIFGIVMLGLGYAASQVMSQSPPPRQRAAPVVDRQPEEAGFREGFNDEIRRVRDKLADNLAAQRDPFPRDSALLKALDKYIASDKLSKIIMELDEFAKQSPETDEAKKAIDAIQLLTAEPRTVLMPTPDRRFLESAPIYDTVKPRTRNTQETFEGER